MLAVIFQGHARHFNFFGDYLQRKYGTRVLKIPIDAGLSCPNRDGSLGEGGCIFCSEGSASPAAAGTADIRRDMESAKSSFKRVDDETKYIAYFQAFTNTYGDTALLKSLYDASLEVDGVIGLMIGTRPDCCDDEILDLIASYKRDDLELWIEIGMQSGHDRSLAFLKRRHDHASTVSAVRRAKERGIDVCLHLILGIPGETWSDMMATAAEVNRLDPAGVKIHHLHVISGTELERLYREEAFSPLLFKEYVSTLCDFLERLNPAIIIHRIMGDREENTLVAPLWGLHKGTVIKAVEDEFDRRGTCQGFLYEPTAGGRA